MRSPTGLESREGRPHGDGDLVVVGGRESRLQGEGGQVVQRSDRGGTRDVDRRKRLWTWLSGYRRAVHLETCTHGSEGGGGDGAVKQPRRPPTLLAVPSLGVASFALRATP